MSRKTFTILMLTGIALTTISFMSGLFYEKWQESKSTLAIDRPLALLMARPSDFEIIDGEWSFIGYSQDYTNLSINKFRENYEGARSEFRAYFPATNTILDFVHIIGKYKYGEVPKTTFLDETYLSGKAVSNVEIHLLNLEELDENSQALCILSQVHTHIICSVESKYNEIISTFSISSSSESVKEEEIVNFIKSETQKFYTRLSKSTIK